MVYWTIYAKLLKKGSGGLSRC